MPNLPTDNLYKFLTTLGVAISLFSFWMISEGVRAAEVAAKAYEISSEHMDNDLEHWTELVRSLEINNEKLSSQVASAQDNKNLTKQDVEVLFTDLFSIQSKLETAVQMRSDVERNQKSLREKHIGASTLIETASSTLALYRVGYFGGFGMALVGFLLWYHRHQKYQDQIVRQQASSRSGQNTVSE